MLKIECNLAIKKEVRALLPKKLIKAVVYIVIIALVLTTLLMGVGFFY
jgi:hypothetical protein